MLGAHGCGGSFEFVRDAPGRAGVELFGRERPAQSGRRDRRRTGERQDRQGPARSTVDRARSAPYGVDRGAAETRLDHHPGIAGRRQQQQLTQLVVESTAATADHDDPLRSPPDGAVEGQLEVGGVLVGREPGDHDAESDGVVDVLGPYGVEVTDQLVGNDAEPPGVVPPGVGGEHQPGVDVVDRSDVVSGSGTSRGRSRDDERNAHEVPPLALPRSGSRVDGPEPSSQPTGVSSPFIQCPARYRTPATSRASLSRRSRSCGRSFGA